MNSNAGDGSTMARNQDLAKTRHAFDHFKSLLDQMDERAALAQEPNDV